VFERDRYQCKSGKTNLEIALNIDHNALAHGGQAISNLPNTLPHLQPAEKTPL